MQCYRHYEIYHTILKAVNFIQAPIEVRRSIERFDSIYMFVDLELTGSGEIWRFIDKCKKTVTSLSQYGEEECIPGSAPGVRGVSISGQ